jgi:hypothetical protein
MNGSRPKAQWNDTIDEWQVRTGDLEIWSPNKESIDAVLDRLDEAAERREENLTIFVAVVVGALILGLAAIAAALLQGCVL